MGVGKQRNGRDGAAMEVYVARLETSTRDDEKRKKAAAAAAANQR